MSKGEEALREDQPYENTLSVEELRRAVRDCWDRERLLLNAIRDAADFPPPRVLSRLGQAGRYPQDWESGARLQREYGRDAIPPVTECEMGAGVWARIRHGLLAGNDPEKPAPESGLREAVARLLDSDGGPGSTRPYNPFVWRMARAACRRALNTAPKPEPSP